MPQLQDGWLLIGRVGKAHGLRGDFFISDRSAPLTKNIRSLRIGSDWNTAQSYKLLSHSMRQQRPVVRCEGIQSPGDVAERLHQSVWVLFSELRQDQELTWADLWGRAVLDVQGQELGVVTNVYNVGASDIAVVEHVDHAQFLELPLVENYIDFHATTVSNALRLCVDKSVFEEMWEVIIKK